MAAVPFTKEGTRSMTPLIVPRAGAPNGFFAGSFAGSPLPNPTEIDWVGNLDRYADHFAEAQKERYNQLKNDDGVRLAYWRSDKEGLPCNGGIRDAAIAALRMTQIEEIEGPLVLCTKAALHATLRPPLFNGSRLWIVALHGEVIGDDEKFGALRREIVGEAIETDTATI